MAVCVTETTRSLALSPSVATAKTQLYCIFIVCVEMYVGSPLWCRPCVGWVADVTNLCPRQRCSLSHAGVEQAKHQNAISCDFNGFPQSVNDAMDAIFF